MAGAKKRLRLAIVEIAKEDTGGGGLVPLHGGKVEPIVRWGHPGQQDPPITAFQILSAPRSGAIPDGLDMRVLFSIVVPRTEPFDGVEEDIADRLRLVLTNVNLAAKNVDATVKELTRPDGVDLGGAAISLPVTYQIQVSD